MIINIMFFLQKKCPASLEWFIRKLPLSSLSFNAILYNRCNNEKENGKKVVRWATAGLTLTSDIRTYGWTYKVRDRLAHKSIYIYKIFDSPPLFAIDLFFYFCSLIFLLSISEDESISKVVSCDWARQDTECCAKMLRPTTTGQAATTMSPPRAGTTTILTGSRTATINSYG